MGEKYRRKTTQLAYDDMDPAQTRIKIQGKFATGNGCGKERAKNGVLFEQQRAIYSIFE